MVYNNQEIRNRIEKYGTVYLADNIVEDVSDIIGHEKKKDRLEDFFEALKKYETLSESLKKAKLTPNLTVLLYGPPGTGKTTITRALCKKHDIPLCVVEADRLVSPLLGDTVKNIRNVCEVASEIAKENGAFVLFFDEIDAIASERSNAHEVGEIKRAVISFLQIIDKITYFGIPLAIFGATNHSDQLDSAVWRRFTFHLYFDFPNYEIRYEIIRSFLSRIQKATITVDEAIFSKLDNEFQFIQNEIEYMQKNNLEITNARIKQSFEKLKKLGDHSVLHLTQGYTGADLERATRVALLKAIKFNMLSYDNYVESLKLVGGTQQHVQQQEKLSTPKTLEMEDSEQESQEQTLDIDNNLFEEI